MFVGITLLCLVLYNYFTHLCTSFTEHSQHCWQPVKMHVPLWKPFWEILVGALHCLPLFALSYEITLLRTSLLLNVSCTPQKGYTHQIWSTLQRSIHIPHSPYQHDPEFDKILFKNTNCLSINVHDVSILADMHVLYVHYYMYTFTSYTFCWHADTTVKPYSSTGVQNPNTCVSRVWSVRTGMAK